MTRFVIGSFWKKRPTKLAVIPHSASTDCGDFLRVSERDIGRLFSTDFLAAGFRAPTMLCIERHQMIRHTSLKCSQERSVMAKLPKYHLTNDKKAGNWRLEKEGSDRATKIFDNKGDATKGGALSKAIGKS